MKNYEKNRELSYNQYLNVNNFYHWTMSQKLPVNSVEWIEDTSQFNEDLIKIFHKNEGIDKVYFLEVDVQYIM